MFHELRNTARVFNNLGIELPAESRDALALADAINAATQTNAATDLNQSIIDGNTTAENIGHKLQETALALVVAERIQEAAHATQDAVYRAFNTGIRDNADTLVKALRKPFDAAAHIITEAGRRFAPDANAGTVLAAGVEAAKAWEQLTEARNTMAQIRNARTIISDAQRDNTPNHLLYIAPTTDLGRIYQAEALFTRAGDAMHQLTHAGFTLRLNTAAEAKAMVDKAKTTAQRAAEQAAAAARAAREADPHSEVAIRRAIDKANA
jgi:hypothetical protein